MVQRSGRQDRVAQVYRVLVAGRERAGAAGAGKEGANGCSRRRQGRSEWAGSTTSRAGARCKVRCEVLGRQVACVWRRRRRRRMGWDGMGWRGLSVSVSVWAAGGETVSSAVGRQES